MLLKSKFSVNALSRKKKAKTSFRILITFYLDFTSWWSLGIR